MREDTIDEDAAGVNTIDYEALWKLTDNSGGSELYGQI